MTDIVEQAARKVFEHQIPLASDKPRDFDDPKFLYERNKAFDTAQDLADAGLLVDTNTHTNSPDTENPQQQAENIVARTVPTREEIAVAIMQADREPHSDYTPQADAVLALMADQPTVAEVKAEALEGAAELLDQPRALWFEFGIGVTVQDDTNRDVELTTWLRHRAQQHRDGK